jgi:hypothetical protein
MRRHACAKGTHRVEICGPVLEDAAESVFRKTRSPGESRLTEWRIEANGEFYLLAY